MPLSALVVSFLAGGAPSPLFVEYQRVFAFNDQALGLIYGGFPVGLAVSLIATGGLSDTRGRRPVMIICLAILAAAMVLYASAESVHWFVIARLIQGFATGTLTGAAAASAAELAARRNSAMTGQLVSAAPLGGLGAGALIAAAVAVVLAENPQTVFLVFAAAFALLLVFTVGLDETVPAARRTLSPTRSRRQMPQVELWVFVLFPAQLAGWMLMGFLLAYNGSILKSTFGAPSPLLNGAILFAMFGLAAIAARFGSMPSWAMVGWGATAVALGASTMAWAIASVQILAFLGATALSGIGFGAMFSGVTRLAIGRGSHNRLSASLTHLYLMGALSNALPVFAIGLILDRVGITDIAVTVTIATAALGVATAALAAVMARRTPV